MKISQEMLDLFFTDNKKSLYFSNLKIIRGMLFFLMIFISMFSFASFHLLENQFRVNRLLIIFLTVFIFYLSIYILIIKLIKHNINIEFLNVIINYTIILTLLASIIIIAIFIAPITTRPTFFLLINVLTPSMFILSRKEIISINLVTSCVFLLLSYLFRQDAFIDDSYIAIGSIVIGLPYNLLFYRIKMEDAYIKKLYYLQAYQDTLSDLPNRRAFLAKIQTSLNNFNDNTLLFAILDLDNFKNINDKYGHTFGDYIIKEYSLRLRNFSDENQIFVSRIGGDEFILFGLNYPEKKAKELLQEIVDRTRLFSFNNDVKISISIGSFFTRNPKKYVFDEIFNIADESLYKVKTTTKNNYEIIIDKTD
ncbi:GGDEF domain-containing protein [Acholeplasma granularum]|uniref:GGDEF domain-containing protein n=1 Tax=Acholeplasma granularum TaxID=264635 RepID=UPI000472F381|nr:GGDEF domain-containing protein [Acholeplasma granularum]